MTENNDAVNESLSAMLDNEHSELDIRRVLKAAQSDLSVSEKWASYQLTRSVLKRELNMVRDSAFLDAVRQQIANETPVSVSRFPQWQHFAGKFAVAACVTFAFLVGVNQWSVGGAEMEANSALAEVSNGHESMAVVPSGFELPPLNARTVSSFPNAESSPPLSAPVRAVQPSPTRAEVVLSPELEEQLNRMMLKHADYSSANGGLSVIPLTRVGSVKNEHE